MIFYQPSYFCKTLSLYTLPSLVLLLMGCGIATQTSSLSAPQGKTTHLRAVVTGGQQPIAGASVQMYAVGTTGDQSSATPLLTSPVFSNATGGFDLDGLYTCPSASSQVYLTATAGNPGLSAGASNAASVLMLSLGACGGLSTLTTVNITEVTTVASAYPLIQFMTGPTMVGSSPANSALLADDFARTNQYVDIASGLAAPSGSVIVPTNQLYALANSVAACVNSIGGKAGDGSACGTLFADATPPGSVPPIDTLTAVLNIASNPTANVPDIFSIATPSSPFAPTLSIAPSEWNLRLPPSPPISMPARNELVGEYLLTEGTATLAHDTSGNGYTAVLQGPTWESSTDLNFTQSGQILSLPTSLNNVRTWQFAFYNPPDHPPYTLIGSAQPPGYADPGDGTFPSILCGTDTAHLCLIDQSTTDSRSP